MKISDTVSATFSGFFAMRACVCSTVASYDSLHGQLVPLGKWEKRLAYPSLTAPRYPPSPIEMAPAINSAIPAKITVLVPRVDKPAVRANGTVRPSDKPIMASEMILGSILKLGPMRGLLAAGVGHSISKSSLSRDDSPLNSVISSFGTGLKAALSELLNQRDSERSLDELRLKKDMMEFGDEEASVCEDESYKLPLNAGSKDGHNRSNPEKRAGAR